MFTIYQTTNLLDGKIYIGKHICKCAPVCEYLGSGLKLQRAIKKYGAENFKKEILHTFVTEAEMNAKEAELVNEEFVDRDDTYNICFGGHGGFGYLNSKIWTPEKRNTHNRAVSPFGTPEFLSVYRHSAPSAGGKATHVSGKRPTDGFLGKEHSAETKAKMSAAISAKSRGNQNSQFGTMWITNGTENRKLQKSNPIPDGWRKGRS